MNRNVTRTRVSKKKLKPVIAPGSTEPLTKEELDRRMRAEIRSKEIGRAAKFDGESEHENPYRAEAMLYIIKDMDVPKELKLKIKQEDEAYKERIQADK